MVRVFRSTVVLLVLVMSSGCLAGQARQANGITITGRIDQCDHHKCGFIRLVEVLQNRGKHRSAVTPVRADKIFTIHAAPADLVPDRYGVEYSFKLGDVPANGEIIFLSGMSEDVGLVCDLDCGQAL